MVGSGDGPPLRLRVLGDSTAAGVGAPTEAGSLPVQLAERVGAALERRVAVTGYGVSGARTADVLTEQLPLVADLGTDVLVIVVGSNDVTHLTPPWSLDDRTARMLRAATELGAPVVLGGIPRFSGATALPEPLRTTVDLTAYPLRAAQERAAAEIDDVVFVNIATQASPRFRGVPEAMSEDDFHPSPVGYGFWADALAVGVLEALGRDGELPDAFPGSARAP